MDLSNKAPKWAGAPTYPKAWRAIRKYQESPSATGWMKQTLNAISVARTISIRREQMESLPEWKQQDAAIMLSGTIGLPFPVTYFDFGGARSPEGQLKCHGALCIAHPEAGDLIFPVWEGVGADWKEGTATMVGGIGRSPQDQPGRLGGVGILDFGPIQQDAETAIGWTGCLALSAVDLINSPGVELHNANPSRGEKRKAVRSGGGISLTVVIRQPRHRVSGNGGGGSNYSHRFERRAHPAFHPATSPMGRARPELLRIWPQKPGRLTRRVLVPATIVGPENKPLIPKRRFLSPT